MTAILTTRKSGGFTLTELVIVILGILASVAVPRYLNMNDDAAAAARSGVAAGLNSSIQMVHTRWLAQGSPATVTLDGGLTVTMNSGGYPDVGTTYNSAATCATLVGRLMGGATPAAAADCTGVTVPLRTGYSGGACQVNSCPTAFATPIALSPTLAQ
jgi:MSHA pilin protein MshA